MNSYQRFRKRLAGEAVDRPPNFDIMMTFAVRYIGQKLRNYYNDYRVLCEANLAVTEDFELDIVQAISDPYREAADLGLKVEFPENDLPVNTVRLLSETSDLSALKPPRPEDGRRMSDRIAAVGLFRERVGGEIPIMGWVEGGLAEAADLRGVSELMLDLIMRPEWVTDLLEFCVQVEIAFAEAQVRAGADIIGLGDSIASQISPAMYERFALPYEQRIFEAVHRLGGTTRLHICGNTTYILPMMLESGADIIDLDWMVDLEEAAKTAGDKVSLCGNFDPVKIMLQGDPEQVYQATQQCLAVAGDRSFSMPGCEVPAATPHPNLEAQRRALYDYGKR